MRLREAWVEGRLVEMELLVVAVVGGMKMLHVEEWVTRQDGKGEEGRKPSAWLIPWVGRNRKRWG